MINYYHIAEISHKKGFVPCPGTSFVSASRSGLSQFWRPRLFSLQFIPQAPSAEWRSGRFVAIRNAKI